MRVFKSRIAIMLVLTIVLTSGNTNTFLCVFASEIITCSKMDISDNSDSFASSENAISENDSISFNENNRDSIVSDNRYRIEIEDNSRIISENSLQNNIIEFSEKDVENDNSGISSAYETFFDPDFTTFFLFQSYNI